MDSLQRQASLAKRAYIIAERPRDYMTQLEFSRLKHEQKVRIIDKDHAYKQQLLLKRQKIMS